MRDFGRGNSGPRRNEDRQTFKAICADCGRDCDLPFEPRGNRPVYCRDCFKKHAPEGSSGDRYESRDSRGSDHGDSRGDSRRGPSDRPMFSAVCDNCGKTCQIPFQPRSGKPVFCSRCFEDKEKGIDMSQRKSFSNGTQSQSNSQMDAINAKLDKILNLLSNTKTLKSEVKTPEVAKAVVFEALKPKLVEVKAEKIAKVSKPKKKAEGLERSRKIAPAEVIEASAETPKAE